MEHILGTTGLDERMC